MRQTLLIVALALLMGVDARAQSQGEFPVTRAAEPPKIDGALDDDVWKVAPLPMGEWASYNPIRGDKMPAEYRTEVRIAYDDRNVYFAIHCFDNEPDKIRTTVSKRDAAFSDDWIAMSLDSAGTGQSAYHLFANPSGSQMDALNTSASGEQFDADFVWYSVARTTSDGYTVEIQLPLQTLRFKGGDQVRMGLLFFRKISRIGVSYSWPEMLPGQWVFDRPAHIMFSNLKPRRLVELLPSLTYGIEQDRGPAQNWNKADGDADPGLSGKFGITSGITLDGTINPDFSQVESDAFQVEVNQRFPVFYSEKRPFFMEGMGLFNLAGTSGPGNMRTAVHTRKIVNPFWGAKLTGTAGKSTFGVLSAWDDSPHDTYTTIARATYALRRSDYIGAIATDTEHDGRHNRVAGADVALRFASHQLSGTFLSTETGGGSGGDTRGSAGQVSYNYNTRRVTLGGQIEHYGRDFQMDTAFYNRTGFTSAWSFGGLNFFPKQGTWLQRVSPNYFARRGQDDVQGGSEALMNVSLDMNFTRQGFLSIGYGRGHEAWLGRRFVNGGVNMFSGMQMFRWLGTFFSFNRNDEPYYDQVDPFLGKSFRVGTGFTLQPNQHLSESVDINTVRFSRKSTGEQVYRVNIVNSKTTYQFDKHFLVRFLAQYDSSAERVLTDLLASYEVVPGTVFHAGYGALYEKGEMQYRAVSRGLFFKASYLRRF